jgi:hypothetical protein
MLSLILIGTLPPIKTYELEHATHRENISFRVFVEGKTM